MGTAGLSPSLLKMSVGRLLRLVVAVGLTALVLWRSRPAAVLQAGAGADPAWILAAIGLVVFDRALMAYRWLVLLRAVEPGRRPPFSAVMRVFFVSTFVGTFLPSVGGDLVRAFALARYDVSAAQSAASVFMDRVLGAASIVLIGIVGIFIAGSRFALRGVVLTLAIALACCVLTALVVFSDRAAVVLRNGLARLPFSAIRRGSDRLLDATRRYRHHRRDLTNVLLTGVAVQALRIIQAYCLGRAIGITAGPLVYFALVPLILLIMLLPITVNGLGTSQLAFVWFFAQVGVAEPQAFALSVLFVALGIVGNLPGGVLYAFGGAVPARERSA